MQVFCVQKKRSRKSGLNKIFHCITLMTGLAVHIRGLMKNSVQKESDSRAA